MSKLVLITFAGALLVGCGSDDAANGAATGAGASGSGGPGSSSGSGPQGGDFALCGGAIFGEGGTLDAAEYEQQARRWDRATIDCRLGPRFADLSPGAGDERPTAWEPEHQQAEGGYLCKTYELSGSCNGNCDYGSTAGQVLYADAAEADAGVMRVQTYGYENGVICESPQSGGWLGGPNPDPGIEAWAGALGRPVRLPNGFSQTELVQTNGGIMIFPDGLVGATGNQTSGDSKPWLVLPPNKVPSAVAVSSYNEFAFVTVWDTDTHTAQVAVLALRADSPGAFSVPYFALPNEAGFKAIHLMGYIDLPDMKTPTAIAASFDNGNTPGGHVIGFEFGHQEDPTKNIMTSVEARSGFARDDYERWVGMAGQAIIASRWENKVTFLDLRPLAQFVREVYFGADDALRQAAAAPEQWPFTFDTHPEAMPVVAGTIDVEHPKVVRIGNQPSKSSKGDNTLKALVGGLDGTVSVFDITSFVHDAPRPIDMGAVEVEATVAAGRNPTSMSLRGRGALGTDVLLACRGERAVQWIGAADDGTLSITRSLTDTRFGDPVIADGSDRGPVVTIGDFDGEKLLNFRVGLTEDNSGKPPAAYGCGPGGADSTCAEAELGGELSVPGSVFYIGTTNVN